eukprot:8616901-Heterocapsa_arctica.AAC.1
MSEARASESVCDQRARVADPLCPIRQDEVSTQSQAVIPGASDGAPRPTAAGARGGRRSGGGAARGRDAR